MDYSIYPGITWVLSIELCIAFVHLIYLCESQCSPDSHCWLSRRLLSAVMGTAGGGSLGRPGVGLGFEPGRLLRGLN